MTSPGHPRRARSISCIIKFKYYSLELPLFEVRLDSLAFVTSLLLLVYLFLHSSLLSKVLSVFSLLPSLRSLIQSHSSHHVSEFIYIRFFFFLLVFALVSHDLSSNSLSYFLRIPHHSNCSEASERN